MKTQGRCGMPTLIAVHPCHARAINNLKAAALLTLDGVEVARRASHHVLTKGDKLNEGMVSFGSFDCFGDLRFASQDEHMFDSFRELVCLTDKEILHPL